MSTDEPEYDALRWLAPQIPITQVPVTELMVGTNRGFFARQTAEDSGAYGRRVLADIERVCDGIEDDKAKTLRYAQAMADGAQFPPILVLREADVLFLGDGHHRAAAAVLLDRDVIPAVVIDIASDHEANRILDLFYYLEIDRNLPTQTALGALVVAFGREQVGCLAGGGCPIR